ncbi:MAG: lytic murein transglycosylase B [Pseudomonadota bacterium]|nr:lytic murein transglycosylase B [Pseudomonadota bacterium]
MTTIAQRTMLARAVMRGLALAAFLAASAASAAPPTQTVQPTYADRPDVRIFIDEMVADYAFDARALRRFFAKVRYQQTVVNAMSRPVLAPPKWYEYAPQFLSSRRIDGGVAFWRANAATLERAQKEFGVPAEVVVAIIGVETFYGRNTGSYRVADALTTLAFDYPRRAEFFRNELKQFLLQTREQKISPLAPKGSYAGAQGLPQFMPGSLRDYAVDYDDDGKIDLAGDVHDAVGSVANYLAMHGWQTGDPVMEPAAIEIDKQDNVERALDGGISDRRTLESWRREGVYVDGIPNRLSADSVGMLMLEDEAASGYWMVFNNWYVLTRYNRSRLYASAVWKLAQEIKRAYAAN